MPSFDEINHIAVSYGTPFYIFDRKAFIENYDNIYAAFKNRYKKLIIGYSYKTNYIPYLCQTVQKKGGFAEVVSRLEYDLALKIASDPRKIIFNGPVKHYQDIELALNNQSIVNLDSWYEIEHVSSYAEKYPLRQVNIGLRINIDLNDNAGASRIQAKLKVSRFGFYPHPDNLARLIALLTKNKNVRVSGLHGHTSTTDRSTWCYKIITETLCEIAARYWPETIEYINIGGGMFGYIPPALRWMEVPTFDDYANIICRVLNENPWAQQKEPTLVIEPGVALAANTLSYITRVIDVNQIRDKIFVTVDGSAFHTKPTFHHRKQPYCIIRKNPADKKIAFEVVGATCMEKDYLLTEITDGPIEPGDFIKIDNVGAYTVVLTPPFINVAPAIVTQEGENYKPLRTRQAFDNLVEHYIF